MPIPQRPDNVLNLSMKEIIFNQLTEWIVTGVLEPGEKISDVEIAKYFNVSKTPVREAFQLLEFYKFIKVFPKKGTCVTKLNTENVEQIYALMINLQELAVRAACHNVKKDDIERLNRLDEALCSMIEELSPRDAMKKDREIHEYIVELADNEYLSEFLGILQIHIERIEYQTWLTDKYPNSHREIIRALETGEEDTAARFMCEHIEKAMEKSKEEILRLKSAEK